MNLLTFLIKKMNPSREITENDILTWKRCFKNNPESIKNYKLFGPSNPFVNNDIYRNFCESSEDGICYMMKCQCFEYEDDISTGDWFKGKCIECDERIFNRKDAWRIPKLNGGFVGCFCRAHFRLPIIKDDDEEDINKEFNNLCDIIEIIKDVNKIEDEVIMTECDEDNIDYF